MRILAFDKSGNPTLGVRRGDEVVDLSVAAPDLPGDLPALLAGGDDAMARAKSAVDGASGDAVRSAEGLTYHPTIWNPGKIICVGLNYAAHAAEAQSDTSTVQDYPSLFLRVTTTLVGHEQALVVPKASSNLDYEAEMVAVIGKSGSGISKADALKYVAGYSVFNEGSVRDYQFKSSQWTSGKNFDATGGFGPDFVTADEVPAGGKGLRIQTRLNGETMQDANTATMIFDIPTLIEIITEVMTLHPGDVIVTGTPEGVGFARTPPVWMKPGDVCEIDLEGVGVLRNTIAAP
ncbi:MAG: fumarylacetoacetate hydrolase family protein [Alphaproteobacteria bacterium]|nr:fumarylacetoacetate hydrolase family protein [Alphaproteobacteria bacterium]